MLASLILFIDRFKSLGWWLSLASVSLRNMLLLSYLLLLVLLVLLDELIKSELVIYDSVHLMMR